MRAARKTIATALVPAAIAIVAMAIGQSVAAAQAYPESLIDVPSPGTIECGLPVFGLTAIEDKLAQAAADQGFVADGLFVGVTGPVVQDEIDAIDADRGDRVVGGLLAGVVDGGCVALTTQTSYYVEEVARAVDFDAVVCRVGFADDFTSAVGAGAPAGTAASVQAQYCDANLLVQAGGGAMFGDVGISVSCLGQNGRLDANIVNHGDDPATYVVEFGLLRPRQRIVEAADWGRISISGRPDGEHPLRVARNGVSVLDTTVTVACDGDVRVSQADVAIINACRDGYGYLLFQLVNEADDSQPYVIEFDNVPNRSALAEAHGAAVRAVTGRPNGTHGYVVRAGGTVIDAGVVDVDC